MKTDYITNIAHQALIFRAVAGFDGITPYISLYLRINSYRFKIIVDRLTVNKSISVVTYLLC
ncbi:hypothetical protein ACR3FU_002090 [Yersinia enterocolitica]